jgi:hypothetical protein
VLLIATIGIAQNTPSKNKLTMKKGSLTPLVIKSSLVNAEKEFKSSKHLNGEKLQKQIQGYVRAPLSNEPIVSAKIMLIGTTLSTISNERGYFNLMVPDRIRYNIKDSAFIQIVHQEYLTRKFKIWSGPFTIQSEQVYLVLPYKPVVVNLPLQPYVGPIGCCFCIIGTKEMLPIRKKKWWQRNKKRRKK